ncbi:MAG: signal peptidase II [Desulforhopalus sp.]|nr:signal peptidase II [Desulforhopalus sp.]
MSTYQWINRFKHNSKLVPAVLLLVTIGSDQYTKFLVGKLFDSSTKMSFLNSFLELSFIRNHGGFLGIVNNLPEIHKFFLLYICVSFLLLACLIYLFYLKKRTARYNIPLVFVTGGGISNLLDRLLHDGGVTDFLSIGVGDLRTGIFNLADIYILFGSFFLGYLVFASAPNTAH